MPSTRDEIGFTARYYFEQALSATIDWYLDHMEWVRSVQKGSYRQWIERHYRG